MADILNPTELQPKDILRFVETRAERALEVLREIIDMPDYSNAQLAQAMAPNQLANAFGNTTAWIGTGTGSSILSGAIPMQAQQGAFNG